MLELGAFLKMPRFTYTAFDARGAEKSGQLDAANTESAATALKAQGLFPVEISAATAAVTVSPLDAPRAAPVRRERAAVAVSAVAPTMPAAAPARSANSATPARAGAGAKKRGLAMEVSLPFLRPASARELAAFTRQLGTLIKAGLPLLRGLEVLARQQTNATFRRVIESLADDIRSGGTLSEAMARHPRVFDRLYINMIKAGEAGGVMELVLARLATFQEKSLTLRGKVKAAMVYPIIVMTVAVTILAGLLVFVVPKFKQIFADLLKGAPLPALTEAVLTVSDAVRQHYLITLGVVTAGIMLFRMFRRTGPGARVVDGALLRLPVFGDLVMKSLVARFARTLGTLLSSGVPILQAITITRDTASNVHVASALDLVHDAVRQGEAVSAPFQAAQIFPAVVTSMIDVGEHTGQLPEMLNKVADIYDEEVDTAVAGLSSMIEPILIVLLAGIVGTIVIALFLPIIRIVQLLT